MLYTILFKKELIFQSDTKHLIFTLEKSVEVCDIKNRGVKILSLCSLRESNSLSLSRCGIKTVAETNLKAGFYTRLFRLKCQEYFVCHTSAEPEGSSPLPVSNKKRPL